MKSFAPFLLFCLALSLGSHVAGATIRFESRQTLSLGNEPNAAAFVGGEAGRLLVAGADGLLLFARQGSGLVEAGRLGDGRGAGLLAAQAGLAAVAGRDAAQVRLVPLTATGFGTAEAIDLPALPRVVRAAPLGAAGDTAVFVLHDDGLSLLTHESQGWQRRELAAPQFGADLAAGDVSGDGCTDLVVADEARRELHLLRGDCHGGFEASAAIAAAAAPHRVVIADLTGDRLGDLLVLADDGLSLHAAVRDGGFAAPRRLAASPYLADVAVLDVNGDQRPDLLLADRSRGVVGTLLGSSDGGFAGGDAYLVGAAPEAVLGGDIDGDGRADALALSRLGGGATLLRGSGNGRFDGVPCALAELGELSAVVAEDFNGDDWPDLAVASESGGTLGIFLGTGDGRFRALPPIRVGRQPRALAVSDFNQDGKTDLAVANFGGDAVAILLGDGAGNFAAPLAVGVGTGPSAIGVGSFRGPTSVDLAIVNSLSNSVSVLYGNGRGQFPDVSTFPVTTRPSFLIIGDTNEDGNQDLVVGGEFSESVAILLGTGAALSPPATNQLSATARPSVAEDFDHDGEMDLVNPDQVGGAVEILPGVDDGAFGSAIRVTVGRDPRALATADFDRDGRIDIAVVHRSSQTIAVLLNRSPAPAPPANRRQPT
ncbi:MAG: VCBS repeat-containing protein [Deltaproteobacteria bacterium]|nr:VCBS repeat-containing protein [Deltaproteobacteria bacterium]